MTTPPAPADWSTGMLSLIDHPSHPSSVTTPSGHAIHLLDSLNPTIIQAIEAADPTTIWLVKSHHFYEQISPGYKANPLKVTGSYVNRNWRNGSTERFYLNPFAKVLRILFSKPVYVDLGPQHSIGLQPSMNDKNGVSVPPSPLRDRIMRVDAWQTDLPPYDRNANYGGLLKSHSGSCAFLTISEFFEFYGLKMRAIPDFKPQSKRKDWQVWTTRGYPAWEAPPAPRELTPAEHAEKMRLLHQDM